MKKISCGSSCVKYILENQKVDAYTLKRNMFWITELALNLKKNGLSNIEMYCYKSNLYNDFFSKKVNLNFDGFKYLKAAEEQKIQIKEKNISVDSFIEEIDSCKYLILCVESKIFNNDDSMNGGHYIILNGRDKKTVRVINPIKEKYEIKMINIEFLIEACKNYGAWRILIKEEK